MPLLSSAPTSDNHTITPPGLRPGGDPAVSPQGHEEARGCGGRRRERFQRQLQTTSAGRSAAPKPTSGKHTHAKRAPCRRRKQEGRPATCRRPPHHDACRNRSCHARTTGTSSPPHDVQGTCAAAPAQPGRRRANGALRFGRPGQARATTAAPPLRGSEAWWAWADLNGRPHAYQACALTS